jgi:cobalamin-dependent methionine synthase I
MGLTFLSEEQRNPINQSPAQPPVDPCAEIQAQLDELQQFIDENNLLKNFYMWQELRDEFNKKKEIEAQGGFEEVK